MIFGFAFAHRGSTKNYIKSQNEDLSTVKVLSILRYFMLLTVQTGCSWCLYYVLCLCGFYYGAFHVESCRAFVLVF